MPKKLLGSNGSDSEPLLQKREDNIVSLTLPPKLTVPCKTCWVGAKEERTEEILWQWEDNCKKQDESRSVRAIWDEIKTSSSTVTVYK